MYIASTILTTTLSCRTESVGNFNTISHTSTAIYYVLTCFHDSYTPYARKGVFLLRRTYIPAVPYMVVNSLKCNGTSLNGYTGTVHLSDVLTCICKPPSMHTPM